jgi:arabinogalactan oligomer / maltooligosaccharide transport system permease protein
MESKKKSLKASRVLDAIWSNLLAFVLVVIWLIPVLWVFLSAFSTQKTFYTDSFFPTAYTFDNFKALFSTTKFGTWLLNTFILAISNAILTTLVTVITAYCLSRFKFKGRKGLMNVTLILGMFPGFMAMVAVYLILNMLGLVGSIWALLLYYVAGAGMGFFVTKGYFDTLPTEIDEAAKLDGANHFRIFFQIYLPLAMPIIIYTALMAFMAPWADYILAGLVLKDDSVKTVAVGLYAWMDATKINSYFTKFAAASVIVSIPIVGLYLALQKFFIAGISSGAVKG